MLVSNPVWKVNVGGSGLGEGPVRDERCVDGGELDIATSLAVSSMLLLALCRRGDLFCLLEDAVDMVRHNLHLPLVSKYLPNVLCVRGGTDS